MNCKLSFSFSHSFLVHSYSLIILMKIGINWLCVFLSDSWNPDTLLFLWKWKSIKFRKLTWIPDKYIREWQFGGFREWQFGARNDNTTSVTLRSVFHSNWRISSSKVRQTQTWIKMRRKIRQECPFYNNEKIKWGDSSLTLRMTGKGAYFVAKRTLINCSP